MSYAITFNDSFKAVENLVREGLNERAAKAIIQTITQAQLETEPATKSDLSELETRVVTRIVMWGAGLVVGQFVATVGTFAALYAMFN